MRTHATTNEEMTRVAN